MEDDSVVVDVVAVAVAAVVVVIETHSLLDIFEFFDDELSSAIGVVQSAAETVQFETVHNILSLVVAVFVMDKHNAIDKFNLNSNLRFRCTSAFSLAFFGVKNESNFFCIRLGLDIFLN